MHSSSTPYTGGPEYRLVQPGEAYDHRYRPHAELAVHTKDRSHIASGTPHGLYNGTPVTVLALGFLVFGEFKKLVYEVQAPGRDGRPTKFWLEEADLMPPAEVKLLHATGSSL